MRTSSTRWTRAWRTSGTSAAATGSGQRCPSWTRPRRLSVRAQAIPERTSPAAPCCLSLAPGIPCNGQPRAPARTSNAVCAQPLHHPPSQPSSRWTWTTSSARRTLCCSAGRRRRWPPSACSASPAQAGGPRSLPSCRPGPRAQPSAPARHSHPPAVPRSHPHLSSPGNSICCHVHGFAPYFYCAIPPGFGPDDVDNFRKALNVRRRGLSQPLVVPSLKSSPAACQPPASPLYPAANPLPIRPAHIAAPPPHPLSASAPWPLSPHPTPPRVVPNRRLPSFPRSPALRTAWPSRRTTAGSSRCTS